MKYLLICQNIQKVDNVYDFLQKFKDIDIYSKYKVNNFIVSDDEEIAHYDALIIICNKKNRYIKSCINTAIELNKPIYIKYNDIETKLSQLTLNI